MLAFFAIFALSAVVLLAVTKDEKPRDPLAYLIGTVFLAILVTDAAWGLT